MFLSSGCGDPLTLAENDLDNAIDDNIGTTNQDIAYQSGPERESNSTRYICIQCGDKEVTIFRETAV